VRPRRKRSSIKCLSEGQRSTSARPPVFLTAGLGLDSFLTTLCRPKVSRALRRSNCAGIIAWPLLGVGPSFKVFRSGSGAREDANCSKQLLLALGPSPNKSLQRAAPP
jgi:hypothetical protein